MNEPGEAVDTRPAKWPSRTTIKGRTITIVPLDPNKHLDDLYKNLSGSDKDQLYTYLAIGPFTNKEDFHNYLVYNANLVDAVVYTLIDNESAEALGIIGLLQMNLEHRTVELGRVVLSPKLQRTTASTEAMYLMARHAFDDLGYRRLKWKTHSQNTASRRAAIRLGFAYEGTIRQHLIVKGHNRDSVFFSILDKEWPDRKRRLESWLSLDNFDDNGVQKISLSALNKN